MAVDAYGITKLQPDMSGGMKWEPTNWSTSRSFSQGSFDPNDTWVKATGVAFTCSIASGVMTWSGTNAISNPRIYIVNPDNVTQWRDVEVTAYFKVTGGTLSPVAANQPPYSGMEAVARTSHGWFNPETQDKCDSRGIDARMRYDGHIDFEKETSHPDSTAVANKTQWTGGIVKDTWIGYKFLCYDLPNGDVKVELWMDTTDGASGGTWVKLNEFTDNGTNMGGSTACAVGVDSRLRLTKAATRLGSESGIPNIAVYFRADNIGTNGMQYKRVSVREIDASGGSNTSTIVFGALNPSTTTSFGGINDDVVVAPPSQPTAPTISAIGGSGTVTASWAPTSDGGSPITGWLVRAYPQGEPAPAPTPVNDPNARSFTFSGLPNDTPYAVEVAAVNLKGASPFAIAAATPAAPKVPPDSPTGLNLLPLDTGIRLNLTQPANLGTGTLTGYQVTATDTTVGTTYLYSVTSLPSTLLGLPNGRQVSVEARTVTTDGISGGTTGFVTPVEHPAGTTPPDAPTAATTAPYAGALGLTYTAPAVFGTYNLDDYVIRASAAAGGQFDHWYVTNAVDTVLGGLGNDVDWTIDIWARSAAGKSLTSLTTTGRPDSTGASPTGTILPSYSVEPPITDPDPNPIYWVGYLPPSPTDVGNPDVPPPPPRHVDPPNIFAFYPAGTEKADETVSDGAFSPFNWAGLT